MAMRPKPMTKAYFTLAYHLLPILILFQELRFVYISINTNSPSVQLSRMRMTGPIMNKSSVEARILES